MIRRKKERKHFFCLSLSLSPLLTTSFPLPDPSFRLFLLPLGEGFKKITMSRLAILCSLVLAALAGVAHSQSADWGSPAANSTAQALAEQGDQRAAREWPGDGADDGDARHAVELEDGAAA